MNHRVVPIAVFALGTLLLGGCNSGARGGAGAEELKLVFIPKSADNTYFVPLEDGLKKEASTVGESVDTEGPAKTDATSQLPIIKDQVQRAVDIIVISANDPAALDGALDEARSKGVTVVTVDSDLTGNESHRDLGILPIDFSTIGPSQIELLGKQIGYQGDIAILSSTPTAPNQNAWIAGMQETLKQSKYSKMRLVAIVYGNDEPQKSSTEMQGLLTKFPDLRGVISPTTAGMPAAAQVLENSGEYPGGPHAKGGGVVLTGLALPNTMKKAVEKGVVASFQLWDPQQMGLIAAALGAQIHDKKFKPKPGATADVPGVGKVTVGDKSTITAGSLVTFDKSNIDKYNF